MRKQPHCFVCGLRHEAIQRSLLSESDLSYAKAIEIASTMEAAEAIYTHKTASLTDKGKYSQACYWCNRAGHSASTCKFKDASCHACGKKGHIAPACSTETPTEENSSGDEYYLLKLGEKSSYRIKVPLLANGQSLEMEVDTGSGHLHHIGRYPEDTLLRPEGLPIRPQSQDIHRRAHRDHWTTTCMGPVVKQ